MKHTIDGDCRFRRPAEFRTQGGDQIQIQPGLHYHYRICEGEDVPKPVRLKHYDFRGRDGKEYELDIPRAEWDRMMAADFIQTAF